MWLGADLEQLSEGIEITTSEIPWAYTAELPLARYLYDRDSAVNIKVQLRVIEGELAVGLGGGANLVEPPWLSPHQGGECGSKYLVQDCAEPSKHNEASQL